MAIEHAPWIGQAYRDGIEDQRIAVVAFSHFDDNDADSDSYTERTIRSVIGGEKRHRFFGQIRNYFGYEEAENAAFWNRIVFFNCLPSLVGGPQERHGRGTKEQLSRVGPRFRELMSKHQPHKAIFLTAKGWAWRPAFDAALPFFESQKIERVFSSPSAGVYVVNDHRVMAFGLRHPERAPREEMQMAVRRILSFRAS